MLYQMHSGFLPKVRLMNSVAIQPPYIHNRRKGEEYIVYVIKKGKMFLTENHIKYTLIPGDFIVLDVEYVHEGYEASYCEYYYIHFRHENITRVEFMTTQDVTKAVIERRNDSLKSDPFSYTTLEKDLVYIPKYYHFNNYSEFLKICCLLDEASRHNNNTLENYKVLCSVKVLEAFIETYRSYVLYTIQNLTAGIPKSYRKVQELLEFLNTSYAEKITSASIAENSGCNFDYLNRVFKQITHKTIFVYLCDVRINHAKELITSTNMKLSEVGLAVGFSDLYYFSKVFKKATGISPSLFAKGVLK